MDVIIERATENDQAYIDERIRKDLLDPEDATWDKFFVAKFNGKTVAFGRVIDHGGYLEIASLGVDYYHRKRGLGLRMLEFLLQAALDMDAGKDIYGVTHIPGFLNKVGFSEVSTGPTEMEHKRHNKCKLDASKIKIMKYEGNT
ncbi:GNAT family N-acetyltransferase [Candidatus Omnitrophota bacterium]